MPETSAAFAAWGAADAGAAGAAAAGAGAVDLGTVAISGAAAGGLGAGELAAGIGAGAGGYGVDAAMSDGGGADLNGNFGDGSGSFGDASALGDTTEASAAGIGPNGTPSTGGSGDWTDLFKKGGTLNKLLGAAGPGVGMAQILTSLYGLQASNKLKQQSAQPGMTQAGLTAVQRSMAAQGYQGSGNMMTALEKYGAQTNTPNLPGTEAGITGAVSSLGLLTSGIPKLFGWGS